MAQSVAPRPIPVPPLRRRARPAPSIAPSSRLDRSELVDLAERALSSAPELERSFIRTYREQAPTPRPDFLWGWVIHALEVTELPGVRTDLIDPCRAAKFLGVMLVVVLDDVADTGTCPDVVATVLDVVFRGAAAHTVPDEHRAAAEFGRTLVVEIDGIAETFPSYEALRGFLAFDRLQLESAMRYSALVNASPDAANVSENVAYLCHNMNMVVQGTIDLMARDGEGCVELGEVRALLHTGQLMGRIGNAMTTWTREAREGDLTSTVFPMLSDGSGLTPSQLRAMSPQQLTALDHEVGAEVDMLAQWRAHRDECQRLARRIGGFDAGAYVTGLETLLSMHLASRGRK